MSSDWLLGADRHETAADHIYAAAADLITRHGFDCLTVETVARHAHCSRATVYRHTGGVTHLRETVLARAATRITDAVDRAIADQTGPDRAYAALTVALREIRAEPVITAFLSSEHGPRAAVTFARSPALNHIAAEFTGIRPADPLITTWLIRSILQLLLWPADPATETLLLQRFLLPTLTRHEATEPRGDDDPNPAEA
ncbi:TetR/AcrR family transcriptional regulator [Nocardia sp. CA2R105]|uniref:TetR/AcrR family transcriptional regulator n=1 Tax=Nocardia coffeae TaxID=2873381 RepID=UPI001CA7A33A|nr:TetR/AcrR family transcriptional regulator [Nocardia coffeae]MBY8859361.1 TetR/AcrR family transcriptional regulator [Nocardia coffeae]